MKLSINDFAKIKSANIIVDGITVIAGENNTGKSTVGKILFSLFNSFSGIEKRIAEQRIKEVEQTCRMLLRNNVFLPGKGLSNASFYAKRLSQKVSQMLTEEDHLELQEIRDLVAYTLDPFLFKEHVPDDYLETLHEMAEKIYEILNLPEQAIMPEIITRYFSNVFHGQINSLIDPKSKAVLNLSIKEKEIALTFSSNKCLSFSSEIALLHNAIYIDNPFIIDKLSCYDNLNTIEQSLKDLLTSDSKSNIMDGIIESVLAKEKLTEIYETLQTIISGQIVLKQDGEFYFEKKGFEGPISLHNLSTGLKSFVILKMLIEKGLIKEKDVLILDEPEIHLHPQWQVAYAELIVLLQKYFNLSITVTTHSPYFLDAINLFSVKYGINEKVNYYLSSIENDEVKMTLVTANINLIYEKMASPIQALDSLRYELNNN